MLPAIATPPLRTTFNPYPARLEELHHFLEEKYGHRDRQATEILLTGLFHNGVVAKKRPWFIIETDYGSRDCTDAWFSFGGVLHVESMFQPRVVRPRYGNEIIHGWLERRHMEDRPGFFCESEWRRLRNVTGTNGTWLMFSYNRLLSECLRLKVEYPRGRFAYQIDTRAHRDELARLTRRVLDPAMRPAAAPVSDLATIPASFLFWCEAIQRLAGYLWDWDTIVGCLTAVARGVAYLHNDGRRPDWGAVERLIRGAPNQNTLIILKMAAATRKDGFRVWDVCSRESGMLDKALHEEIRRLRKEGVLVAHRDRRRKQPGWSNEPWRYALASSDWAELVDTSKPFLV